ncbi:hypothetical protein [Altererythrobacter sp. MF3-039]|uniref:head-tail connector protein n=1 Tax=Altererythrobacter sp. MF3-039 TaxID=3252901 RepID=UPI00390C6FF0
MKRAIVVPAPMPVAAREELKRWLSISSDNEDALMETLLRSSFDLCEAFTWAMPLEQTCEEHVPASTSWQALSARPVISATLLVAIPNQGSAQVLASDDYELDIDADQIGRVRMITQGSARRLQVQYVAGLASNWDAVPDGIRQGIIRLAAHHYRERDGAGATPPASVAALWRPWRRLRLV